MKQKSAINWITFSREDSRKAREYLESLRGDSTVDVLGLQKPMEFISEVLFPATSTLHKRIRYQIFVPSILWAIYKGRCKSDAEQELRAYEVSLQRALLANGERQVFGKNMGEALRYWPSLIYWNSINQLHFWGAEGLSQQEVFDTIDRRHNGGVVNDDGEHEAEVSSLSLIEPLQEIAHNMFVKSGISKETATFRLTYAEARFLRERVLHRYDRSLSALLLKRNQTRCLADDLWSVRPKESKALTEMIKQAKMYSVFAAGTTYAYRWALCRARQPKGEGIALNEEHFENWLAQVKPLVGKWRFEGLSKAIELNTADSFDAGDVPTFVDAFLEKVSKCASAKPLLGRLEEFLRARERNVKGSGRSHFDNPEIRMPDNAQGRQPYSLTSYDYRWTQGSTNARDIIEGLRRR